MRNDVDVDVDVVRLDAVPDGVGEVCEEDGTDTEWIFGAGEREGFNSCDCSFDGEGDVSRSLQRRTW